ncbi:MAG: 4-alpha-glucanotransferase [Phycisphaerales bacterium]|nr:4-alpha-glucanotransferase [Phycisphaerales bacterium]
MKARINPLISHRSAGVLCHLSSLRGPCAIGDLGLCAREFIDWCRTSGATWWQMLPVGPIGPGDSPYASTSSFAGEPLFISLDGLREQGLLSASDVRQSMLAAKKFSRGRLDRKGSRARTDYDAARRAKEPAFLRAFESFRADGGFATADYAAFARREKFWLSGWSAFNRDSIGYHAFLQFTFDTQWRALRSHAKRQGIKLLGDLPIFVTLDSADVAEHPELFRLDSRLRPEVLTGVPPDCFSRDGQLWGHPHYRWSAHRSEKFRWWTARIAAALRRFDGVRIDHFVGFQHAYEIPAGATNARRGVWKPQAGREVLDAALALRMLPLLAEDLGAVTPKLIALRKRFNLPGMHLLHHSFGSADAVNSIVTCSADTVIYPGTHDNDTSRGWFSKLDSASRRRFLALAGDSAALHPHDAMTRIAYRSNAQLAVVAVQDLLGLDRSARMNLPGTATNNWRWRLGSDWQRIRLKRARQLHTLAKITGRSRRA